jgi:hypothetical protein
MILILSSQEDQSTTHVIDWLRYFNVAYLRISELDHLEIEKMGP